MTKCESHVAYGIELQVLRSMIKFIAVLAVR